MQGGVMEEEEVEVEVAEGVGGEVHQEKNGLISAGDPLMMVHPQEEIAIHPLVVPNLVDLHLVVLLLDSHHHVEAA